MEDKASQLFNGEPSELIRFLKYNTVDSNKLRQKIYATDLIKDLTSSGFTQKLVPYDARVIPVIDWLSEEFESSIKPFLINEEILSRTETETVLESTDKNPVTLIKAESGMGKSALLYELHQRLCSNGTISIPIRLDRRRPESNADDYGRSLGFPYSPIQSLFKFADSKKIVFILDQLDAIRWTASHSNNALQVCQELVKQVLSLRKDGANISIVFAVRNFDLNEDVALSSWLKNIEDEVHTVSISALSEETVVACIKQFENYTTLSEKKKNILKIPLWLSIYLSISKRTNSAPKFDNKLELVKTYWDNQFSLVQSSGISEDQASNLINEIVKLMTNKSRSAISENLLPTGKRNILGALISVGILTSQNRTISFRHQSLLDYQVGQKLFLIGIQSSSDLISELGDFSQQTLTKREHLKYALSMLLDSEQERFCECIVALLNSNEIRFHLKYLVLNTINEIDILKKPAKNMIDELASSLQWREKFLSISCHKNISIIAYLSDKGFISNWLNSTDRKIIDATTKLLNNISEKSPEIVLKELSLFVDKSRDWNDRVYRTLCWNIEDDSDEMFNLRLKLISIGCQATFIDWKTLFIKHPERALTLIERMLFHYKDMLGLPRYSPERQEIDSFSDSDTFSTTDLEDLKEIPKAIPERALRSLLSWVINITGDESHDFLHADWLDKDQYGSIDAADSLTGALVSIIKESGKELALKPKILLDIVNPSLESKNGIIRYLNAHLLLNLPVKYADQVVNWLLSDPKYNFTCGNTYLEPRWFLPGKLIEKFSSHCSEQLFQLLENEIYKAPSYLNKEHLKEEINMRKHGQFNSIWGETQYFLIPKLDSSRLSLKSKNLIAVLNRKFKDYKDSDFCSRFDSSMSLVTSPISRPNKLSDRAWRNILTNSEFPSKATAYRENGNKYLVKSSIRQFSNSLSEATESDPIRFSKFALTLPPNIKSEFIQAFYFGLERSESNREHDTQKTCPTELVERVIKHFDNHGSERELARLTARKAHNGELSEETKVLVIDLARNAEDPVINQLNVYSSRDKGKADSADAHTLEGNALNCTRGIAYRGITRLFWQDKQFAKDNKHIVEYAINDPHPAVNITAVEVLLAISNIDKYYAEQKFLDLCNKDLRMACANRAYYMFNSGFSGENRELYTQLVLKMQRSTSDDVKKEAAREIYARWFFYDLFQDEVSGVINGDKVLQEGCASVVRQFLLDNKYNDRIKKIIPAYKTLVNCNHDYILRSLGGCVSSDHYWTKPITGELFQILVESKAAKHCLWVLFKKLENLSGSLTDYSEHLLALIVNLTENLSEDERYKLSGISNDSFIKVLQRLYDEATEDEDKSVINTCLDIWDKLLKSNLLSAIGLAKQLDNGLLS